MAIWLNWERSAKRKEVRSGKTLAGSHFCQVQAQAPGTTGFWNRRFWSHLFRQLAQEGHKTLICGGQPELVKLGKGVGLPPPDHLPLLRQLAAPLARYAAPANITPILYSRRADALTVNTAVELCESFPQLRLCVGRGSEELAEYLYQKLGAACLIGQGSGPYVHVLLEDTSDSLPAEGIFLDLTLSGMGLPRSIRDAWLTGPELSDIPAAYQTDLVCELVRCHKNYKKSVKIAGIPGRTE
jgi:hypothetical protein